MKNFILNPYKILIGKKKKINRNITQFIGCKMNLKFSQRKILSISLKENLYQGDDVTTPISYSMNEKST